MRLIKGSAAGFFRGAIIPGGTGGRGADFGAAWALAADGTISGSLPLAFEGSKR